jgi:hypothetical protein
MGLENLELGRLGQTSIGGTVASAALPVFGGLGQAASLMTDRQIANGLYDLGLISGALRSNIELGARSGEQQALLFAGVGAALGAGRAALGIAARAGTGTVLYRFTALTPGARVTEVVAQYLARVTGAGRILGHVGEKIAQRIAWRRGEIVLNTQYGKLGQGFDFASVTFKDGKPQLMLSEVKNVAGRVGAEDLTAFGLSGAKSAARTLEKNLVAVRRAILGSEALTAAQRVALVEQLAERSVVGRLIGSSRTKVTEEAISALTNAGFKRVQTVTWW